MLSSCSKRSDGVNDPDSTHSSGREAPDNYQETIASQVYVIASEGDNSHTYSLKKDNWILKLTLTKKKEECTMSMNRSESFYQGRYLPFFKPLLDNWMEYNRKKGLDYTFYPLDLYDYVDAGLCSEFVITADREVYGESPGENISKYFRLFPFRRFLYSVSFDDATIINSYFNHEPIALNEALNTGMLLPVQLFIDWIPPKEDIDKITLSFEIPVVIHSYAAYATSVGDDFVPSPPQQVFRSIITLDFSKESVAPGIIDLSSQYSTGYYFWNYL